MKSGKNHRATAEELEKIVQDGRDSKLMEIIKEVIEEEEPDEGTDVDKAARPMVKDSVSHSVQ